MYKAKVLPGDKKVGRDSAASSEGRKWRRWVASDQRPRHPMPDAVERNRAPQFLETLNLAPESEKCVICRTDTAFPETFKSVALGPPLLQPCTLQLILEDDCQENPNAELGAESAEIADASLKAFQPFLTRWGRGRALRVIDLTC